MLKIAQIKLLIESKKYLERIDGYSWLGEYPGKLQRKYLVQGLMDNSSQVRANIADFMGKSKDPFFVDSLLILLADEKSVVRFSAADSLGYFPKKIKLLENPLLAALSDDDSTVRMCAAESLGDIKSKKSLPSLKKMVEHDSNSIARCLAISAIGYIGDCKYVSWLESLLEDENDEVKAWIFTALIELDEDKYFDDLIHLLRSRNYHARLIVINSLSVKITHCLGEREVLEILENHTKIEKNTKCLEALKIGVDNIKLSLNAK